jgi:hypothetical protein
VFGVVADSPWALPARFAVAAGLQAPVLASVLPLMAPLTAADYKTYLNQQTLWRRKQLPLLLLHQENPKEMNTI